LSFSSFFTEALEKILLLMLPAFPGQPVCLIVVSFVKFSSVDYSVIKNSLKNNSFYFLFVSIPLCSSMEASRLIAGKLWT